MSHATATDPLQHDMARRSSRAGFSWGECNRLNNGAGQCGGANVEDEPGVVDVEERNTFGECGDGDDVVGVVDVLVLDAAAGAAAAAGTAIDLSGIEGVGGVWLVIFHAPRTCESTEMLKHLYRGRRNDSSLSTPQITLPGTKSRTAEWCCGFLSHWGK